MMFAFQLVCLCITLIVLQKYVASGMYSRSHRLLPLVLGLIGVYNFYQVLWSVTGEVALFTPLKDLLVIQMLYLMLFYIIDFLQIRMWPVLRRLLFLLLIISDVIAFLSDGIRPEFQVFLRGYIFCYILFLVVVGTYAFIRYFYTKREYRVTSVVYLAMLVPTICLYLDKFHGFNSDIIMPISLMFTCIVVYYLIVKEQLMDPLFLLQQNQFETQDVPVVFFDADCYYLGANQAAKRMFPEAMNIVPRRSRPEQYIDKVREMTRNLDRERELKVGERYYKCKMDPMYDRGTLRGYCLSITDITEQKKETKLMASLRDAAEMQTVQKSRFLATMSHDLRSPLHAIIGISDVLAGKRELSGHNRSLVLHIRSAGLTLLDQVEAILDYSKLEAGRLELAHRSYSFDSIVEGLAHMSVINLQSKPVRFSLKIHDRHPGSFIGDEMRVREIIQNLLSNAVKFTITGEISCDITCRMEEDEHRAYIGCSVTDTGPGMDEEQMKQIFEEYVSYADSQALAGSGLGLCIVRQLAELMGGTTRVASDGHSGSTVSVFFYQDYEEGVELKPPIAFTRESILRQTSSFTRNIRPNYVYPEAHVLLAEDMRINQEIFRELASPWQFVIDVVSNGIQAVEAVGREHYDLIFLDQIMPEMTGIDAADAIRRIDGTPVIMMTADLSEDVRNDCLAHGCSDFLSKPIAIPMFQKVIETYLPQELRRMPAVGSEESGFGLMGGTGASYRRSLQTFLAEMEPLLEELEEYAKSDMDMFRVKVHGLKGACGQIGRGSIGEMAEIMEMAAKTENITYIQSHMEAFLQEIADTMADIGRELARIPSGPSESAKLENTDSRGLFARMKAGFDAYRLEEIEDCIRLLERSGLSESEQMLLEQAKDACEELDYERGSRLLAKSF